MITLTTNQTGTETRMYEHGVEVILFTQDKTAFIEHHNVKFGIAYDEQFDTVYSLVPDLYSKHPKNKIEDYNALSRAMFDIAQMGYTIEGINDDLDLDVILDIMRETDDDLRSMIIW